MPPCGVSIGGSSGSGASGLNHCKRNKTYSKAFLRATFMGNSFSDKSGFKFRA